MIAKPRMSSTVLRWIAAALVLLPPGLAFGVQANVIRSVTVNGTGPSRQVIIHTSGKPTFTVFRLSKPMRVVVDISGGDLSHLDGPIDIEDGVVGQIATRQFNAGGFLVGRVIVGFEKSMSYNVRAEGNSVVVSTGPTPDAPIDRTVPPPAAPVDRAAAERFEKAKQQADAAAARAQEQRAEAQTAAKKAQQQQAQAEKISREAEKLNAQAQQAKAAADALRQQAQDALTQDRAKAEAAAQQAQQRLAELQAAAQEVQQQKAEAQRLALVAERAQRNAEESAAKAEAQHKERVAELQQVRANAEKEKKAAEAARAKAAEAEREAQQAQQAADAARAAAERTRADVAAKLAKLQQQQQQAAALRAKAETERQAVAAQRRAVEAQKREVEQRDHALQAKKKALEAKSHDVAQKVAELGAKNQQMQQQSAKLDARAERLAAKDRTLQHKHQQLEAERQKLEALRAKLQQEQKAANEAANQTASRQQAAGRADNDRAALAAQRARLKQQTDALAEARANLKAQQQGLAQQQQDLAAKQKAAAAARVQLAHQQAALKELQAERAQVTKAHAALAQQQKALQAQQQELDQQRAALAASRKAVAAQQAQVQKQRAAVQKQKVAEQEQRAKAASRASVPVKSLVGATPPPTAVADLHNVRDIGDVGQGTAHLTGVTRYGHGHDAGVLLQMRGRASYQVLRVDDPPRLVVDLAHTERDTHHISFGVRAPYVRRVRLGDHGKFTRAVFDLTSAATDDDITQVHGGLLVALHRVAADSASDDAPTSAKPAASGSKWTVRDVSFSGKGTTSRITLDVKGIDPTDIKPHVDSRSKKTWVMALDGATLPKDLERSLDTSAYGTVVRLVSSFQDSTQPPVVKVVANLTGHATYSFEYHAHRLEWKIVGRPKTRPPQHTVASAATPQTAGYAANAAVMARSTPTQVRSHKRRISIDLKDADIVNVLRLLSEVSGENIITSSDVKGTITLRLRNVPWDTALNTILRSKGLDKVRENNILLIAPAEEVQKQREMELAKRKAQEEVEEKVIKIIAVNYASAKDIVGQLKPMLSGRGSVQVDERTNTLIVEDVRSNIDRLVELVHRLDRQTPQVLIEARIVEASSNYLQQLGIQWGGTGQATAAEGNATGLAFPSSIVASGAADDPQRNQATGVRSPSDFAVNLPAPIGSGAGGGIGFTFGSAGGSQLLNMRLTALQENGTGRIISSPRITTLDNRMAKIEQGVQIPVSVVSAAGTNTRFIPAVLSLQVTPHVTNDGSVLMKMEVSKDDPDFSRTGAQGDPTIVRKYAKTEVLVPDGNTTVIGGIYTRTKNSSTQSVPFFGKIPLLGWLFKSTRKEDNRDELLVFITPRIVNREASMLETNAIPAGNVQQSQQSSSSSAQPQGQQ